MKKTNLFILLTLMFFSCKNDEVTPIYSPITSDGLLSGNISNFNSTIADSVVAVDHVVNGSDYSDILIAKSIISSEGKFSIKLPIPINLNKITELGDFGDDVTISDSNAMLGSLSLRIYKSGIEVGRFYNYRISAAYEETIGDVNIDYFYCDRLLTIKGTINSVSGYTIQNNDTIEKRHTFDTYNMTFKKGWNALAINIDKKTVTGITTTTNSTISTTIPQNIPWVIDLFNSQNIKANVKFLDAIKPKLRLIK